MIFGTIAQLVEHLHGMQLSEAFNRKYISNIKSSGAELGAYFDNQTL